MCTDVHMSLQKRKAGLLGIDPTSWVTTWVRVMMELEYPLIDAFHSDHVHVVEPFHERFPNAPIPFVGPASWNIQYSFPLFDNQDAWREMELGNQRSRHRLTRDRDFIIAGLGLPFERLYFEARAQLRQATNELSRYRLRNAVASYDEFRRSGRPRSSP